ncbi:MAG: hypothetical protein R2744_08680 [Bacteroidales bacterium]
MFEVLNIVISMLLLVSTTGVTVTRHYCGNNLRSVSLLEQPSPCCDDPGCCHNEYETIKVKDEFSVSSSHFNFELFDLQVPVTGYETVAELYHFVRVFSDSPSPPDLSSRLSILQSFIL